MSSAYHTTMDNARMNYRSKCYTLDVLAPKQRELCGKSKNVLDIISTGASLGIEECQIQFSDRRWNCTTFNNTSVFGKVLERSEYGPKLQQPSSSWEHGEPVQTVGLFVSRKIFLDFAEIFFPHFRKQGARVHLRHISCRSNARCDQSLRKGRPVNLWVRPENPPTAALRRLYLGGLFAQHQVRREVYHGVCGHQRDRQRGRWSHESVEQRSWQEGGSTFIILLGARRWTSKENRFVQLRTRVNCYCAAETSLSKLPCQKAVLSTAWKLFLFVEFHYVSLKRCFCHSSVSVFGKLTVDQGEHEVAVQVPRGERLVFCAHLLEGDGELQRGWRISQRQVWRGGSSQTKQQKEKGTKNFPQPNAIHGNSSCLRDMNSLFFCIWTFASLPARGAYEIFDTRVVGTWCCRWVWLPSFWHTLAAQFVSTFCGSWVQVRGNITKFGPSWSLFCSHTQTMACFRRKGQSLDRRDHLQNMTDRTLWYYLVSCCHLLDKSFWDTIPHYLPRCFSELFVGLCRNLKANSSLTLNLVHTVLWWRSTLRGRKTRGVHTSCEGTRAQNDLGISFSDSMLLSFSDLWSKTGCQLRNLQHEIDKCSNVV